MSREEQVVTTVALSLDALRKIYSHVLYSGKITDLVNNREDIKEINTVLQDSLDELNSIIALNKLLKVNNIK